MFDRIKEIHHSFKLWIENRLRALCGEITPDKRFIVTLTMLIAFSAASIYMTVSSIYNIGKGNGQSLQIEHIKQVELELQQKTDSINQLKNRYNEYE